MRGDSDDDNMLAAEAARGDAEALDELLRRHAALVHGVCRRVLGNPDDALDAMQEALLSIARKIHLFDGRSRFSTWCYRVATNAALDEARRRNRRPRPTETLSDHGGPGPAEELLSFNYTLGERTAFQGLRRVVPGEIVEVRNGRIVSGRRKAALPRRPAEPSGDEATLIG